MADDDYKINELHDKLENLLKRQEAFSREVNEVREELKKLKIAGVKPLTELRETKDSRPGNEAAMGVIKEKAVNTIQEGQKQETKEPPRYSDTKVAGPPETKSDLEKFIGENLINKVGIIITIIGVGIGAKYAIDHQLISPLTRILLGYLIGIGLLAFAIRLKKNYHNFSSVLLSGSMAIIYFITYSAYSFYNLFPQVVAFVLMVIITVSTVTAAINYNRQVIAHIGLVGAYAVPFLLSQGSENVTILFSYTAIINIGILVISFRKYWKPLSYSSFLLTWLIYLTWFWSKYQTTGHFGLALTFLTINFVTFYLMLLAYKLLQKEKFDLYDIVLLLTNSFIFYGVGYNILSKQDTGQHLLGLITLGNALIHFIVSVLIYRQKLADRNLFYFVSGLALIFVTIAIPVQLNGNWVTLLWAGEAALLFWIGRTKKVRFYENLSYIIMFFAFFSLLQDWAAVRSSIASVNPETKIVPLFNTGFLTSLLFVASFWFINSLNHNPRYPSPFSSQKDLNNLISFSLWAVLLLVLYCSFKIEISAYYDQLYKGSLIEVKIEGQESPARYWNTDLPNFKTIWTINYSLLFLSVLSFINVKKLRNQNLGYMTLVLSYIALVVFLIQGLYILSELRESYLNRAQSLYFNRSIFNIGIRYVSFAFVAMMLTSIYTYINQDFVKPVLYNFKTAFEIVFYISLIWVISSELISWMDINHYTQSYKLALSILWGVYSLFLIILGIWKKKKYLRIGAISLFGATLMKLFMYDLTHLDTISKTIVFVTLGILLLIISFLYNKYKNIISGDSDSQD